MRARSLTTLARRCALGVAIALLALGASAQTVAPRILTYIESVEGSEEQLVRWPVGVAAGAGGGFAIADAFGPRLLIFETSGASTRLVKAHTLPGAPGGLTHDGENYVLSIRGGGLLAVDGSASGVRELPSLPGGVLPGPIAAIKGGGLLVVDTATNRVLVLSSDGSVERAVAVGKHVSALAPGPHAGFFATVPGDGTVLVFGADGSLEATWAVPGLAPRQAWPVGIAVESSGDVYVSDRHGGRIVVLDASGKWIGVGSRRGWEPGLVRFPAALARTARGDLLVIDQGNARMQIFRRDDRGSG